VVVHFIRILLTDFNEILKPLISTLAVLQVRLESKSILLLRKFKNAYMIYNDNFFSLSETQSDNAKSH